MISSHPLPFTVARRRRANGFHMLKGFEHMLPMVQIQGKRSEGEVREIRAKGITKLLRLQSGRKIIQEIVV